MASDIQRFLVTIPDFVERRSIPALLVLTLRSSSLVDTSTIMRMTSSFFYCECNAYQGCFMDFIDQDTRVL